jgi:hypothetical protein
LFFVVLRADVDGPATVRAENTQASMSAMGRIVLQNAIQRGRFPTDEEVGGQSELNASLVHDPEKCEAVFREDHAQSRS